jgi:anti-sigma B factor antagonist
VPQALAVRSPTVAREYAAPTFVCSWEIDGGGAAWVQVAGELDLATSPQFRQTLGEAQRAARVVVLDLRELCFIDSSSVHVIIDAARDARRNAGRLLIVRGSAPVDRVLALTDVRKQVVSFDLAPAEPAPALLQVLLPGVAA